MVNKQEFLKVIYENPAVKSAMSQIKTKSEFDLTTKAIEEVIGSFYEQFVSVLTHVQNNSEELNKLVIEKDSNLIIDSNNKSSDGEQKV